MSTQECFKKLDLNELQILAKMWATKFPIIDRVYLYRGVDSKFPLYLLYVVLKKEKDSCDKTLFQHQYKEYERECIDGSYLFKGLPNVYKSFTPDWRANWRKLSEWESEPEEQDRLVIKGSKKVLFEDADNLKSKKLRPCQKHREQVRKVAKDLWRKDPTMIYGDIYKHEEMEKLFKTFHRSKPYVEKTISGWINDLNPDRSGGRPQKKSPAVKSQKQAGQKYTFQNHTLLKIDHNK
jgi:hypothetical protein